MNPVRIMIVHKNKGLRHRLADYLTVAGMITVNDVFSLRDLQERAHQCKPHIILLDIQHAGDEIPGFLKEPETNTASSQIGIHGTRTRVDLRVYLSKEIIHQHNSFDVWKGGTNGIEF